MGERCRHYLSQVAADDAKEPHQAKQTKSYIASHFERGLERPSEQDEPKLIALALRQNSLMASQQMQRTAVAKAARRKRVNLREGDVFEIPLPDGRFGYGIVVKRGGLPGGGTPYIAIFRSVFDRQPDRSELTNDEVALQGWTTDALVYHNRWKIIEREAPVPPIQFPNFKVEREGKFYVVDVQGETIDLATPRELDLLNYRFSSTAGIFQDAFEALHGFGEWQDYFVKLTPAYAQSHVTRPAP